MARDGNGLKLNADDFNPAGFGRENFIYRELWAGEGDAPFCSQICQL